VRPAGTVGARLRPHALQELASWQGSCHERSQDVVLGAGGPRDGSGGVGAAAMALGEASRQRGASCFSKMVKRSTRFALGGFEIYLAFLRLKLV
jgi:hypothetical protein|tara:strand:+ start:200 stop:481 length:282 start_codon:yes stop_codon:yes gene_type:complete